jgi:uncharacterized protein YkwD
MLSLSVTLGMGLLLALLSGDARAAQAAMPSGAVVAQPGHSKATQPAKFQTAVWVKSRSAQPVMYQNVRWFRRRGNQWVVTQPVQPAKRPSVAQAAKPAPAAKPPAAQPQTAQAKPAPAEAAKPAPAAPAKPAQVATGLTPSQQLELHAVEMRVIEHTNSQRARYGLRPLKVDFGLIRSARRHTQWMTRNHTMQHSSGVAENIAMGQNSPSEVLNTWMNSSGHRANILNSGYTRIGVAAYRTPQGTTFWCQQFMR